MHTHDHHHCSDSQAPRACGLDTRGDPADVGNDGRRLTELGTERRCVVCWGSLGPRQRRFCGRRCRRRGKGRQTLLFAPRRPSAGGEVTTRGLDVESLRVGAVSELAALLEACGRSKRGWLPVRDAWREPQPRRLTLSLALSRARCGVRLSGADADAQPVAGVCSTSAGSMAPLAAPSREPPARAGGASRSERGGLGSVCNHAGKPVERPVS